MAAESKGFEEGEAPCAGVSTLEGGSGRIKWSDLPQAIRGLLVAGLSRHKQLRVVSTEALMRHPWNVLVVAAKNIPLPPQRTRAVLPEPNKWLNEAFKLARLKRSEVFVRSALPLVDPALWTPSELARFGLFAVLKHVLETGAFAWTGDEATKLLQRLRGCSSPEIWALVIKVIPGDMLDRTSLLSGFRVAVGRGQLSVVKEISHSLRPTSLEWAKLLTGMPVAIHGARHSGSTDILAHVLKGVGGEAFDWDVMMRFAVRHDMKGAAELLVPFYKTAGGTPDGLALARSLGDTFRIEWATKVLDSCV